MQPTLHLNFLNQVYKPILEKTPELIHDIFEKMAAQPEYFVDCSKNENTITFYIAGQKFILRPCIVPETFKKEFYGTIAVCCTDPDDEDKLLETTNHQEQPFRFNFDNLGNIFPEDNGFGAETSFVINSLKRELPGIWLKLNMKAWL